jgi:tetratricopeptide (TPR) repeat protein
MSKRLVFPAFILLAAVVGPAPADSITVRGREKPVLGEITNEDAASVTIVVKKTPEKIPAADVIDVYYTGITPPTLYLGKGAYKVATDAEKDVDSADPAKRKTAITTAIAKYTETLKTMAPHKFANRAIRYRVAVLNLKLAQSEKTSTAAGLGELQKFRTDFPNSWQINQAMTLIAQLQMDAGDFKGATATFEEMTLMDVLPADVKSNAKLMTVQVAVRSGDIKGAQKKLAALEAEAANNPKFASRVKMAKAEVLVGLKQTDDAMKLLYQVIKENNEKDTKALAHNTLGECLFKANRFEEARWEFIWVDTIYNQDRTQHAKALYYLWKTFQQLNDETHAQECRELLLGGNFNGTEWQQKAQKETGK